MKPLTELKRRILEALSDEGKLSKKYGPYWRCVYRDGETFDTTATVVKTLASDGLLKLDNHEFEATITDAGRAAVA